MVPFSSSEQQIQQLEAEIEKLIKQRNALAFNSAEQIAKLQAQLEKTRTDASHVVHALNCAVQLIEALITYTPEGTVLHPGVAAAKGALDHAMRLITGGHAYK
jgi:ElaB/YqjD/DUF883 family membrane-anchored ribosome-binding protein